MSASAPAIDFDAQLMLRVREGDESCFRTLLERHRNSLVHFLYRPLDVVLAVVLRRLGLEV